MTSNLLYWRMFSHDAPHATHTDQLRSVHAQGGDGGATDCGQTNDFRRVVGPSKVFSPDIALRMKERNVSRRDWVVRHHSVRLESVAGRTGEAEVLKNRSTSRSSRNDMLELEGYNRQILGRAAIGTAIRELSTDIALQFHRDIGASLARHSGLLLCKVYRARVFTSVR